MTDKRMPPLPGRNWAERLADMQHALDQAAAELRPLDGEWDEAAACFGSYSLDELAELARAASAYLMARASP